MHVIFCLVDLCVVCSAISILSTTMTTYTIYVTLLEMLFYLFDVFCCLLFTVVDFGNFTTTIYTFSLRSQTDLLLAIFTLWIFTCVRMNVYMDMYVCVMCASVNFKCDAHKITTTQTRKITLIGFVFEMGFYSSLRVSVFFSHYFNAVGVVIFASC